MGQRQYMRAVVQRVSQARVLVDHREVGAIQHGLLVLLGVGEDDTEVDLTYMVKKIVTLRIFEDEAGRMNRSVTDVDGSVLAVSQFTLYGDVRKGRRPSFVSAMQPDVAQQLFDRYVEQTRAMGLCVETGQFGAMMHVELINDGPVTLLIDSKKVF